LGSFKELSAQEIKGKQDLKKKADELTRIALKQVQLDSIQRQISQIQASREDR